MNKQLEGLLGLVILGGLVGGGIVGWLGWQQRTILGQGSSTPQQIRLETLAARGPGDNIHVTVTDFDFGKGYVLEKKGERWNRVWIPMFPAGATPDQEIKVVGKTFHVTNQGELDQFYQKRTLTGVITNSIHSLGSGELGELQKSYPKISSSVWMIEEGRSFPSEGTVTLMLSIAGGLLVLGVGAGIVLLVGKHRARSA